MPPTIVPGDSFETGINLAWCAIDRQKFTDIIQAWINANARYWPSSLTADEIARQIPLVYLPYWHIDGHGTATWYASIGVDRQVLKRCGTCGGRGRYTPIWSTDERWCDNCGGTGKALGTETFWNNQSGYAEANLAGHLVDNYDEKALGLHIGKRDHKGGWTRLPDIQKPIVSLVAPTGTSRADAMNAAQQAMASALEADATADGDKIGDYVRNVKLAHAKADSLSASAYGYPIYMGTYQYDGKDYSLQTDAVTGKFWAQKPDVVSRGQAKRAGIGVLAIAIIAAFVVALYNWVYLPMFEPPVFAGGSWNRNFVIDSQLLRDASTQIFPVQDGAAISHKDIYHHRVMDPHAQPCVGVELTLKVHSTDATLPLSAVWTLPNGEQRPSSDTYFQFKDVYATAWIQAGRFCIEQMPWPKGVYRVDVMSDGEEIAHDYFAMFAPPF